MSCLQKPRPARGRPRPLDDGRFDKTLMLETLSPKETAKIKTRGGMSRVHFGPQDPAGSSGLPNTVTATVPEDRQRTGWLLLLVLCCAQLPPSEVPLSCLQTKCFFPHKLMNLNPETSSPD